MMEDKVGYEKMTVKCPECPDVLLKKKITMHLRSKHPEAFQEYLKNKKDGNYSAISWYGTWRMGGNVAECADCGKSFKNKNSLETHRWLYHRKETGQEKAFKINCFCQEQYSNNDKGRRDYRDCLLKHRNEAGEDFTSLESSLPKHVWLAEKVEAVKKIRGHVNVRKCERKICQCCDDLDIREQSHQIYPGTFLSLSHTIALSHDLPRPCQNCNLYFLQWPPALLDNLSIVCSATYVTRFMLVKPTDN